MKNVDIRIGELNREGRRVFYAYDAFGEYIERFDVDDIEQALRLRDEAALAAKDDLVAAVKKHARANYNSNGWDVLVECWDDSDIVAALTAHPEITTTDAAIRYIGKRLKTLHDYCREIQAEAF